MPGQPNGEPAELEEIPSEPREGGQGDGERAESHPLIGSPEHSVWSSSYLNDTVPCLLLDPSLKIVQANESFCRLYGCESPFPGMYLTQFFSPSFDAAKSADLFRSVLSAAGGHRWVGQVERLGREQLLTISKIWVVPVLPQAGSAPPAPWGLSQAASGTGQSAPAAPTPKAFSAVCLDMTVEYQRLLQGTFASLLEAARLKDNDTGNHIERVNLYARTLAEHILGNPAYPRVNRQFVESIGQVAALHDVGKIGTPDDILNKAGPLEAWEWDVMKQHTTNGAYILGTYPNPMAREIALRHHEKWDGSGYPYGLTGDLIPLSARIVALADVYDALRMRRPYKEPQTHERALQTMRAGRGKHFDPDLLDRFIEISGEANRIFNELLDPSPEAPASEAAS
jgi:putative two-component system response regulator